jgi:TonB family protein
MLKPLFVVMLASATSSTFAFEPAQTNSGIEAVRAAADPANGPPIVEAVVPTHHENSELGPPGPYYPERSVRLGITGVAVIQCHLAQTGALTDCTVLAEAPQGSYFGTAMLKMAKEGYLKAQPPSGFPPDGLARVMMEFPKVRRSVF